MKLDLIIDGREERIEIANGRFRIDDGEQQEASVEMPEPGVYSVLLDGRSYQARVEEGVVTINGFRFEVEVRDPRRWNRQSRGGAHCREHRT